jgi:hypothetical protein
MSELSPAAKTVLDAFLGDAENTGLQMDDLRENVAAALRAAADHCHAQEIREADHTTRRWICVDDLLAIAAEFEALVVTFNTRRRRAMVASLYS